MCQMYVLPFDSNSNVWLITNSCFFDFLFDFIKKVKSMLTIVSTYIIGPPKTIGSGQPP